MSPLTIRRPTPIERVSSFFVFFCQGSFSMRFLKKGHAQTSNWEGNNEVFKVTEYGKANLHPMLTQLFHNIAGNVNNILANPPVVAPVKN